MGFEEFPATLVTCLKDVTVKYETRFNEVVPMMIMFTSDKPYELELPKFTDIWGKTA
jgi:hypothetical protein